MRILVSVTLAVIDSGHRLFELSAKFGAIKCGLCDGFDYSLPVCFATELVEGSDGCGRIIERGRQDVHHGKFQLAISQDHFGDQIAFLGELVEMD